MERLAKRFCFEGNVLAVSPCGNGHINSTFFVHTDSGTDYILQKINHHVFRDVQMLMNNIRLVVDHLHAKGLDERHALTIIPTTEGSKDYLLDEDGSYWRAYLYLTDSVSLDCAETVHDFYQNGKAFGRFQNLLSDFPAEKLGETIPRFHDTEKRYRDFEQAVKEDVCGRAREVQPEIDFLRKRQHEATLLTDALAAGRIPLRVTHNDTKMNNVLLDAVTREPLCVVDLDTVMPGAAAYDFGDAIRFGASTALEDERDLEKVHFSSELYEAFISGYLEQCGESMGKEEKLSLPIGAKLMTYECGLRFLTDHLMGDTYFSISRPGHNLDRARTQLKLIEEMENDRATIMRITGRYL